MRRFLSIIFIIFLHVLGAAPALAQITKSAITTQIANCFPDNMTGAITPAITRTCLDSIVNSYQQFPGYNPQTGTTYIFQVADYGQLVTFNNIAAIAVTLPRATGTFFPWNVYVANLGSGAVTITPTTSTINGLSSISLTAGQSFWIVSDGTNYQVAFQSYGTAPTSFRTRLTGAQTFFFDSTNGVDSPGCGLASGASACKTGNFIFSILQNQYDLNGKAVIIQGACHTTVCAAISLNGPFVGGTNVTLQGDTTTPSNQIIDGTAAPSSGVYCVQVANYATLIVQGFKLQNCAAELSAYRQFASIQFQQIEFGSNSGSGIDIYCTRQSYCEAIGGGNLIDACASCGSFIQAAHQGNFRSSGGATGFGAFKFLGNTTWNGGFIYASLQGEVVFTGYTSGNNPFNLNATTVSGFSWIIDSNGTIETEVINDQTFFPGSATGSLRGVGAFNGAFHEGTTISSGGGAGVAISGDDFNGMVVEGANSTGTTITFGSQFDTAPTCQVTYTTAPTSPTVAVTTSTLTIGHSSATLTYSYNCHGG